MLPNGATSVDAVFENPRTILTSTPQNERTGTIEPSTANGITASSSISNNHLRKQIVCLPFIVLCKQNDNM